MSAINIDYNRGVTKKIHPKNHIAVFMYKDSPGVFLNAFGTEVDNSLAGECGFDVDKLCKEKLKRERIQQVTAMVEAEMNQESPSRSIAEEIEGFKVIHIGMERYIVEDPDGNKLTTMPLPLDTASKLLRQLNPTFEPKPKQQPPVIWEKKPEPEAEVPAEPEVEKPTSFGEKMKLAKAAKKAKGD